MKTENEFETMIGELSPEERVAAMLTKWTTEENALASQLSDLDAQRAEFDRSGMWRFFKRARLSAAAPIQHCLPT